MTDLPLPADLELQVKVSKLVGLGFGLTLAGGLMSPLAIAIGFRARGLINSSPKPVSGIGMAWWCIALGTINSLFYFTGLIYLLTKIYLPSNP